jgi:hypothetical protein
MQFNVSSDQHIQAVIQDPCNSYWLRHALITAIQRDLLDVVNDSEYLSMLFIKRAQEESTEAIA